MIMTKSQIEVLDKLGEEVHAHLDSQEPDIEQQARDEQNFWLYERGLLTERDL